jgi:DNA-binding MarR family transcriptional regulator
MTRIYALERLLEHGPLTLAQLMEITRWPRYTLTGTLRRLEADHIVAVKRAPGGYVYGLVS